MQTFITRTLSAVVFAFIVICALLYNEMSFEIFFLFISLACLNEYYQIITPFFDQDARQQPLYKFISLMLSFLMFSGAYAISKDILPLSYIALLPVILSVFFIIELFLKSGKPFRNIGINIIGIIYVMLPFVLLHAICQREGQFLGSIVFGILLCVWTNDTGAYIVGSLVGRHKLIEHVSPKKTIEGSLGGALFTLGMAYFISTQLVHLPLLSSFHAIDLKGWLIIASLVFVFASIGDLVESLLKRSLDIKDSGSIMPGHGGFLDRFDAFIFVIPFVVCFLLIYWH
jgi:phosphatidate cytidylyltransferase